MKRGLARLVAVAAIAVVPRAVADAPPGRYVIDADTVKDTKTGLVWKRAVSSQPSLETATAFCVAPFRVPEIKELATLVDEDATELPFVDQKAFPGQPQIGLWSNTHTWNHEQFSVFILMPDGTTRVQYYNGSAFPGGAGGIVRCVQ
jgi:hypothetical protein